MSIKKSFNDLPSHTKTDESVVTAKPRVVMTPRIRPDSNVVEPVIITKYSIALEVITFAPNVSNIFMSKAVFVGSFITTLCRFNSFVHMVLNNAENQTEPIKKNIMDDTATAR